LIRLFAHENVDIAIALLELLVELTAEDVELKQESDMEILIDTIFKDDNIDVMIGNLERLDESKEDDQQGVFHTLSRLLHYISDHSHFGEYYVFFTVLRFSTSRVSIEVASHSN
jgi:beta-catenin-like protein 1